MKNPVVLLFVVALFALIAYAVYLGSGPVQAPASQPSPLSAGTLCSEGQTQSCSVGTCSGVSRCINGVWSGCRWDTVCTPGTKVPCLSNGCVYAVKECNQCGTGYTDCFLPNSTNSGANDPQ